ncbi:MAG: FAD-binding oxidoreductase, partial [bacterium]|nr:FAD-binding oxidoreductase [bacterium]
NAGGARATWWNPINVDLAAASLNFFQSIAAEIQFFQKGYLFLYPPSKWKVARKSQKLYEQHHLGVKYLDPGQIPKHLPEFRNFKGVAGATFSPQDGLLDPHLLKEYYQQGAKEKGVRFLDRHYVEALKTGQGKIQKVHCAVKDTKSISDTQLLQILTQHRVPEKEGWKPREFQPNVVINCTGAWLPITSQRYQRPLPIRPIRRQISLFSSHEEDFSDRGMIVDASGLYFHAEGSHTGLLLGGYSNRDEKPAYNFSYDGEKFFDRKIWLRLYRRGDRQGFTALKHLRGWAGLYAVGPDNTAVLGAVPGVKNLFELGAATGRGVMQSYALSRGLTELITQGSFQSLDLSPLNRKRFEEEKFQRENLDI